MWLEERRYLKEGRAASSMDKECWLTWDSPWRGPAHAPEWWLLGDTEVLSEPWESGNRFWGKLPNTVAGIKQVKEVEH